MAASAAQQRLRDLSSRTRISMVSSAVSDIIRAWLDILVTSGVWCECTGKDYLRWSLWYGNHETFIKREDNSNLLA